MNKGRINIARMLLVGVLFFFSLSLKADPNHLSRQLSHYIEQQLQSILHSNDQWHLEINPIDQRLNLTTCLEPLDFEPLRSVDAGPFSLKVSCSSPKPWSIYVRGEIKIERPVLVASQALPRGTAIMTQNLMIKYLPLQDLRGGYFSQPEELLDYQLKRPINKDEVFTPMILSPPLLIRKGDEVTISAGKKGQLEVRVSGVALQDGRLNQQIQVQNSSSDTRLRARVVGRGQVRADY